MPGPTPVSVGVGQLGFDHSKVNGAGAQVTSIVKINLPSQEPEQEIPIELKVAPQAAEVPVFNNL